ncbi:MAG: tRNA pseudouridine(38-40) synthase TruA [Ignavibacteriae bacterium]|nr:tRNA pseudouridine(38-40) synthase TruA [Ignavibacteriota bacterium]
MARFKVSIEYEGTRFSGWQAQKNARTVQGELIGAMKEIFNTDNFELYGSGRTDAGVHAIAQVAHLEIQTMLAPEIIRMKTNDLLPADINILEVEKVSKQFHARHDAIARSYLYQISRRRTAFGKRSVWWIKDRLNFDLMRQTADLFEGLHDFRSFTADDPEQKSTKVKIDQVLLKEYNHLILMRITGSHFIWNLVRRLVGTIAEVGRGKLSINQIEHFLNVKSDIPAKLTAPPSGLFLERVFYPGDTPLQTLEPTLNI